MDDALRAQVTTLEKVLLAMAIAGLGFVAGWQTQAARAARTAIEQDQVADSALQAAWDAATVAQARVVALVDSTEALLGRLKRKPTVIQLPGQPPETVTVAPPTAADTAKALEGCRILAVECREGQMRAAAALEAMRKEAQASKDSTRAAEDRATKAVAEKGTQFWKGAAAGAGVVATVAALIAAVFN